MNNEIIKEYQNKISEESDKRELYVLGLKATLDKRIFDEEQVEILEFISHRLFSLGHISLEERDRSIAALQ